MNINFPNYIFDHSFFIPKNYEKILEVFRHNTNIEMGGYRIYDGKGDHLIQSPEELLWTIKELKIIEKKNKFKSFLEFGYNIGMTNTILNKFFNFEKIVSVDWVGGDSISKESFYANLRFKNFILLCGDSCSKFINDQVVLNSKYDLIFIDGGHDYDVVKNDFELSLKTIEKNGTIVFHDIASPSLEGPKKLWNEIKNNYQTKEFVCKDYLIQYGVGIINL